METIRDQKNVILSSPTGSGKTAVFMEWAKLKQEASPHPESHHVYITSPIKALSNERFRDLESQGYKVGLETGDCKYVPKDCDYICCTQEIYTNKYTKDENSTLIIDEFHYIFENQERQRAYIDGLHDSESENILLCSATFGNVEKLNSHIDKISHRNFQTYENHERLTTLEYGDFIPAEEIKDALVIAFSQRNCDSIASTLANLRRMDLQDQPIPETKIQKIDQICEKYNINTDWRFNYGVSPYYGAMLPKEKLCIEELFHERLLDTVVGTDALALGVNLPVDKVVFAQTSKYVFGENFLISKNLYDQLAGRAGRKGYFDYGKVYYNDKFSNDAGYAIGPYAAEEFEILKNAENESVEISLSPKIAPILLNQRSIEQEVDYIINNSTVEFNRDNLTENIIDIVETVKNYQISDKPDITPEEYFYIEHRPHHRRLSDFEDEGVLAAEEPEDCYSTFTVSEFYHQGTQIKIYQQEFIDEEDNVFDADVIPLAIKTPTSEEPVILYCKSNLGTNTDYHDSLRYGVISDYDPGNPDTEYDINFYDKAADTITDVIRTFQRLSTSINYYPSPYGESYSGDIEFYEGDPNFTGNDFRISEDATISFLYDQNDDGNPTSGTVGFFKFSDNADSLANRKLADQYQIRFDLGSQTWHLTNSLLSDSSFTNLATHKPLTPEEADQVTARINASWRRVLQENYAHEKRTAKVIRRYQAEHKKLQQEFDENIAETYNDQLSPTANCELLETILKGGDPISAMVNPWSPIYDLLITREILRSLPRRYRKKLNLVQLNNWINAQDETILNGARNLLSTSEIKKGVNNHE